ncbi:hypothetical protein [Rufibacter sp. XAAS-G3-1]|uniref:hypothetical protein n=1 Tax=Rufibacter sp. XAAS-G3-1 TaxID=2729134 RepID=UPI0015E6F37D|nr:hypothetical protein [Rufibacter sp. XAAS-G3-1]
MDKNFLHFTNSLGRRYCTIRYLETNQTLHLIWKGTASPESIAHVRAGVLQMLSTYPCQSILSDIQEFFHASSKVLKTLTAEDWDQKSANLGVRYIAHILKADAELPTPTAPNSLPEVKYFNHPADALEWLNAKTT